MGVTLKVVRKRHRKLPDTISGPTKVKVGFPASKASASNIEKAIWNEFGTRGSGREFWAKAYGGHWVRGFGGPIPERPFMRNAMRNNRESYKQAMRTSAPRILRGETSARAVVAKLGILAQGDIQDEILALESPPNAAITIEIKGSSKPLIDTGEMRQAVTWKVEP